MHLVPSVKSLHILALSLISSSATLLLQIFVRKIYFSVNQDSPEVLEEKPKFKHFLVFISLTGSELSMERGSGMIFPSTEGFHYQKSRV